ncbi:hypothetical protein Plec18167_006927 [Paecilomyces lecythidis]|uniref:EDC4-like protein pdc1 beta-propeller domain-containing protein n=1 Tax=Paecilomyces lecythidis TaxID=3004212 RepID=A0ABR3X7X1_9EURO
MSTPSDLQALFASIKPRPSPSPAAQDAHPLQFQQQQGLRPQPYDGQSLPHPRTQQHGYHHPSVSSPLYSPVPGNNTPPQNGSDVISPVAATPRSEQQQQNADRTASLLSLLKFGQNASQGAQQQQQASTMGSSLSGPQQPQETGLAEPKKGHARAISASDLVASFMSKPEPAPETSAPAPAAGPSFTEPAFTEGKPETPTAASESTQAMLLRLLNRPKPSQAEGEAVKETQQSPAVSTPLRSPHIETLPGGATVERASEDLSTDTRDARMHVFGSGQGSENLPFEVPKPSVAGKDTIFTYTNPFDQLAAASPKKTTPQPKSRSRSGSPAVDSMKPKRDTSRTKTSPVTTEDVTAPSAAGTDENVTIPAQSQSATAEKKETVSEALGEVAEQVEREVEDALARASKEEPQEKKDIEDESKAALSTLANELQDAAKDVKEEVGTDTLQDTLPEPVAETVKQTINEVADGALADSWESVEESPEKDEERVVEVYNFPLRPFISIAVNARDKKLASLRDDGIMDVARLKKDFDQLDRSLTSATSEYIVYALAKNGGLRIIRQDDGSDKQVFRSTRDRVFNVALCTTATSAAPSKEQAVLAIGVSGTVYWSTISREDKDLFELDALESESLIFPPYPASDENTSGGQLKTRAKRSSRHPALFGIGRGKNIYVINPRAAMVPEYGVSGNQRVVDTEKFFKERALKISTGKAGKDFVFSEDDTVIASLDKTGRLRFWDIRDMLDREPHSAAPAEVRVPLNTFVTGSPAEKSWPTSVLFIDKLRPYVKSVALRYVLVGLKQNHTLQLWDIGLGKAVQEINFPHENESDAICSVAYHPPSGIIVVGHPTRNSIYFVHLSAPRYNLQPMSQASFIKRSNEKDGQLPKPESTACMSGIREISFASKGQLRSLDLLSINKSTGTPRGPEDNGLFELYVMHSRGVTCINIKKEDLGWTSDNKILRPVDALEAGYIAISDLQTFPSYVADEPSVNGDATPTPKSSARDAPRKATETLLGEPTAPSRNESPAKLASKKKSIEDPEAAINGVEKAEKKKKKKAAASEAAGKVKETNTKITPSQILSESGLERRAVSPQKATKDLDVVQGHLNGASSVASPATMATIPSAGSGSAASGGSITVGISSDFLNKEMKKLEKAVSTEFSKSLGQELEGLYKRFDDDKRAWDTNSTAKQDQLLQIVSNTLSDNMEKNLGRIISNSIQSEVIPAIVNVTSATMGKQVNEALANAVPREVRQVLPDSVARAFQKSDVTKVVSDMVSKKLSSQIEGEFSRAFQTSIKKVGSDMERQMQAQMKHYEIQRQNDSAKIEQLTTLVRGLSDTVASMAAAQNNFQNEILRLNRHLASRDTDETTLRSRHVSSAYSAASNDVAPTRTPEEIELAEIAQLMNEGRYEEGSVKWLQSSQQADLFDNLFVRLNPAYLTGLSPIVSLSVGVAVTSSLETNLPERLSWLEVVLQTVNLHDADIREVAPKIMDILIQRLEGLYMAIAENNPHNPILRKIPPLSRRARELRGSH